MQIEFQILDALQKIHTPVLDGVMCLITSLGNAGIIWILLTIALLINPKIRRTKDGTACRLFGESGRRSGCILLAALILDLILCNGILKNLFHRVRPYDIRTSIELLVKRPLDYSFPSGHTAASFTAVVALSFAGEKRAWKAALVLACLIAFSRMYLYVHYPTDVLGGVLVGDFSVKCLGTSRLIGTITNLQNRELRKKVYMAYHRYEQGQNEQGHGVPLPLPHTGQ